MSNPFLGEIRMFGGNFNPRGWAFCNGQLLPIAQNDALYALIGTTYGGDGQTTFGLPNMQGRVPNNQGQGAGLSNRVIGQSFGTETETITTNQMPVHQHRAVANNVDGTIDAPASTAMPARPKQVVGGNSATLYTDPTKTPVAGNLKPFQANTIGQAGGSQPHENMMPFLAVHFIIALEGVFPSRN